MRLTPRLCLYAAMLSVMLTGSPILQAQIATDANGLIVGEQWLALGPFQTSLGCSGNPGITGLYGNHIGPETHIACQAPLEGDVLDSYDPSDPGNPTDGLTEIPDVNSDGGSPMWWAFDDGSPTDGDLNLDGTLLGDLSQQVMFLATYIEYLGDEPIVVDFCHGTDDDGQVWIDDQLVENQNDCSGLSDCEYTFKALIRPGQHVIKMGVWENGGGWAARLSMRLDGQPIVDGDPDWVFLGREGDVELPDCEADQDRFLVYDPPERVSCEPNDDGSVTLNWDNHADTDPDGEIRVLVNGEVVATLPGGTQSYTIPAAEANGELFCVESANGLQTCTSCSTTVTDDNGNILSAGWLVFGPFNRALSGCPSNRDDLVRNTIPPSRIDCLYPEEGDEVEYEEFDAESSTTGLLDLGFNVGPDGLPLVHPFNDGTNTNDDLSLDGHFGDQSGVVAWMITYVEYVGDEDTMVDICHGTDDDGQIWFNDMLVSSQPDCSGASNCEYRVSGVPITAETVYRIAVGVWETGGGWNLRFRMEDSATGLPIVEGDPDWVFHGRKKPDFEPPECPECDLEPVTNLTCELGPVGFGTGLILTWENPPVTDAAIPTRILVDGVQVSTVDTDATTTTIPGGLLPDGNFSVQVIHCGGVPATCTPFKTDDNGNILGGGWLAFGPFTRALSGCPSAEADLLQNTIPPSNIACVYPEEGDEIEYDEFDPTSSTAGLVDVGFNVGPDGLPLVHPFNDGTNTNDDHDLDDHFGEQSGVVAWMITYVEYVGDADTTVDVCLGTDDDGQVWFNDMLVTSQPDCSVANDCEYRIPAVPITAETVYRIAVGVWETGGGWNLRFRMEDSATGLPIADGQNDDWIFHGINKPDGFEGSCPACSSPVSNLTCARQADGSVEVTWENPEGCEEDITISVFGEEVAVVGADETEVTIAAEDMPFDGAVVVDNGGVATASCSTIEANDYHTDLAFVSAWLYLGPFAQQDGATPGCALMAMDHLTDGATTELDIEPVAGDEIETDYAGAAASLGLNPAEVCFDCNPNGIAEWHEFLNVGDQFDVNALVSAGDNQMSYGMFYVDVADDVTVDIGVDSDDSIQVLAAPVGDEMMEIHCNSVARAAQGANAVADVIPGVQLTRGPWKFMVKVFEGGGGNNWRLQFQSDGHSILPGEISLEPGNVGPPPGASLKPGDVNGDGGFNIADMVAELGFLFGGGGSLPECFLVPGSQPPALNEAGFAMLDFNGDGGTNIADAVAGLGRLFGGGNPHVLGEGCAEFPGTCASNCVP